MTIETPIWMQGSEADPVSYSAREDRLLIEAAFSEGVLQGFAVAQRGAGANNSVDVALGIAVVAGDDQADQGRYLVRSTAVENVALSAPPGANARIDLIVLQIRDPNAGGDDGFDAVLQVVEGVASGSPAVPATPASAIVLARVLRTAGDTSVTNAMITDRRRYTGARALPKIHAIFTWNAYPGGDSSAAWHADPGDSAAVHAYPIFGDGWVTGVYASYRGATISSGSVDIKVDASPDVTVATLDSGASLVTETFEVGEIPVSGTVEMVVDGSSLLATGGDIVIVVEITLEPPA